MSNPKVFISYSHSSDEYKDKIRNFATMLRSHGIDATIDEWELKGGQDLNVFMEKSINNADKVIIACDKRYTDKANDRLGGSGIETYIISPEVYKKHDQTKYIPVIFEKDNNGNPYVPDYIKTRVYYDFSFTDSAFQEESLIRDIFDKPKHTKPSMGSKPYYIDELDKDDPKAYLNPIMGLHRIASNVVENKVVYSLIKQFAIETGKILFDNLITYEEYKNDTVNVIYNKIEKFEDLLNPYITVLEAEILSKNLVLDDLIFMFEHLSSHNSILLPGQSISNEYMWDHINYLIHELFLYTVAILKQYDQSNYIFKLLHTNFYGLKNKSGEKFCDFTEFNKYLESLDIRKQSLGIQRISIHADLLYNRAEKTKIKGRALVEIDLYLSFYSELKNSYAHYKYWFPRLYIYQPYFSKIEIFDKLTSKRHMIKFFVEIGIKEKSELTRILDKYKDDMKAIGYTSRTYAGAMQSAPRVIDIIKVDELGTIE